MKEDYLKKLTKVNKYKDKNTINPLYSTLVSVPFSLRGIKKTLAEAETLTW